jgi:hypothetical protein
MILLLYLIFIVIFLQFFCCSILNSRNYWRNWNIRRHTMLLFTKTVWIPAMQEACIPSTASSWGISPFTSFNVDLNSMMLFQGGLKSGLKERWATSPSWCYWCPLIWWSLTSKIIICFSRLVLICGTNVYFYFLICQLQMIVTIKRTGQSSHTQVAHTRPPNLGEINLSRLFVKYLINRVSSSCWIFKCVAFCCGLNWQFACAFVRLLYVWLIVWFMLYLLVLGVCFICLVLFCFIFV